MKLTNEHRSLIATAFVAAFDYTDDPVEMKRRSLCCGPDSLDACARIVGKKHAEKLQAVFYERLGCCGWKDKEYQAAQEQYFLDKIADLDELVEPPDCQ